MLLAFIEEYPWYTPFIPVNPWLGRVGIEVVFQLNYRNKKYLSGHKFKSRYEV